MAFKMNSSKAQESGNSLKPEGDYEVVIDTAEVARTQNGKEKINIVYVIRNDVTQAFQNGLIFDSIWKKKEPNADDQSVDGFNFGQLMAIASAAKLPEGKDYANLGELLAELVGKPLRVHLYHDDYNGKMYEKVDIHSATTLTSVKHKAKGRKSTGGGARPAAAPAQHSAAPANAAPAADPYPF